MTHTRSHPPPERVVRGAAAVRPLIDALMEADEAFHLQVIYGTHEGELLILVAIDDQWCAFLPQQLLGIAAGIRGAASNGHARFCAYCRQRLNSYAEMLAGIAMDADCYSPYGPH